LQEGEIEPLGSNKLVPFDARVIAATSRDLGRLVREGGFREDLFYRLNVLPLRVPPLRERREDIAALVEVLGEDMAQRSGSQPPELSSEALALLAAQVWRGNIRELRNVLEQALMRSDTHRISAQQLQAVLAQAGVEPVHVEAVPAPLVAAQPMPGLALRPLAEQVAALEQQAIAAAMMATQGNKVLAAKILGISRATLYARLDENA
jgi:DNA-binding NtrC family response regulator